MIIFGIIIGGYLLLLAFGRNILAFGAQTTVPVSKEVINETFPTMVKSIKEGLKDEKE